MRNHPNWHACTNGDADAIDRLLRATCRQGYMMESDNRFEMPGYDGVVRARDVVAHIHPHTGPLRCCTLHSRSAGGGGDAGKERWEFCVSFPVLAGAIPTQLTIVHTVAANCPAMGFIVARTPGGRPITFFEPMFWGNHNEYQSGATCLCSLAGLALEVEPSKTAWGRASAEPSGTVRKPGSGVVIGGADGPVKPDAAGEAGPQIMERASMGASKGAGDVIRCRATVMALDWHDFAGTAICRMFVALEPNAGEDPLHIPLLASEPVLHGYVPAIGDEIEADIWLQGYLASLALLDEVPPPDPRFAGQEDAAEAFACAWNLADIRCLKAMLAEGVLYESPGLSVFRAGKEAVLGYLQQTIDDFAVRRYSAYAELGECLGEDAGRPCVLVGIGDPNQARGVIAFDVTDGCIERILVEWGTGEMLATMARRTGRYPK